MNSRSVSKIQKTHNKCNEWYIATFSLIHPFHSPRHRNLSRTTTPAPPLLLADTIDVYADGSIKPADQPGAARARWGCYILGHGETQADCGPIRLGDHSGSLVRIAWLASNIAELIALYYVLHCTASMLPAR
jgi:hypothetical protein